MKRLKLSNLMMAMAAIVGGVMMTRGAEGSLIEFTFGGQLEQVIGTPPSPWDGVSVGSEFLVTMVFDSETPDQDNSPSHGFYEFLSLEVMVDGVAQAATTGEIRVDAFSLFNHQYDIGFIGIPNGMSGSIGLIGTSVLDSDTLPTTLDLNDWNLSQSFGIAGGGTIFNGQITTFTSQIIPIPGMLVPLSMMCLSPFFRRKRRL